MQQTLGLEVKVNPTSNVTYAMESGCPNDYVSVYADGEHGMDIILQYMRYMSTFKGKVWGLFIPPEHIVYHKLYLFNLYNDNRHGLEQVKAALSSVTLYVLKQAKSSDIFPVLTMKRILTPTIVGPSPMGACDRQRIGTIVV